MNQKDSEHWKSRVLDEIFAALAASQPSRRIFHLMKRRRRLVPSSAFWRRSGLYRSPFPCRNDQEGLRPIPSNRNNDEVAFPGHRQMIAGQRKLPGESKCPAVF